MNHFPNYSRLYQRLLEFLHPLPPADSDGKIDPYLIAVRREQWYRDQKLLTELHDATYESWAEDSRLAA